MTKDKALEIVNEAHMNVIKADEELRNLKKSYTKALKVYHKICKEGIESGVSI